MRRFRTRFAESPEVTLHDPLIIPLTPATQASRLGDVAKIFDRGSKNVKRVIVQMNDGATVSYSEEPPHRTYTLAGLEPIIKQVCYRCGQPEINDVHEKSYGGDSYAMAVDGHVEVRTQERYHAPHQHTYQPGRLRQA